MSAAPDGPPPALTDVDERRLRLLTRCPQKVRHYAIDPHFRRGQALVADRDALDTTFVVLKPDAVAGRRIETALSALAGHGFTVVAAGILRFTPLLTREVWRFQFNIASRDRADVVDLLLPGSDSLLLVLRDGAGPGAALPAACRLAALKGPADPGARRAGDLRTLLRGPTALFNALHTADEPADVVRELSLFDLVTDRPVTAAARRTAAVPPDALAALVRQLYGALPAHDLDATASLRRLAGCDHPAVAAAAARRPFAGWRSLVEPFRGTAVPAGLLWDVLSVATAEIDVNVPGLVPVIPTVGAALWKGAGR